jgi:hypothetical protein
LSGTDLDASIYNLDFLGGSDYAVIGPDVPGFASNEQFAPDGDDSLSVDVDDWGPAGSDVDALSNLQSPPLSIPAPRPAIDSLRATNGFVPAARGATVLDGLQGQISTLPAEVSQLIVNERIEVRPSIVVDVGLDVPDQTLVISGPRGNVVTIRPDEIQLTRPADPVLSESDGFMTLDNPSKPTQSTGGVLIGMDDSLQPGGDSASDPVAELPNTEMDVESPATTDTPSSGSFADRGIADPASWESVSPLGGSAESEGGMIPLHAVVNAAREFASSTETSDATTAPALEAMDQSSTELRPDIASETLWGELTRGVAFEVIDDGMTVDSPSGTGNKQAGVDVLLEFALADASAHGQLVSQVVMSSGATTPLAALQHSGMIVDAVTQWLQSALASGAFAADRAPGPTFDGAGDMPSGPQPDESARSEAFSQWDETADSGFSSFDALPLLGVLALERLVSVRTRPDHDRGAGPPLVRNRRGTAAT